MPGSDNRWKSLQKEVRLAVRGYEERFKRLNSLFGKLGDLAAKQNGRLRALKAADVPLADPRHLPGGWIRSTSRRRAGPSVT